MANNLMDILRNGTRLSPSGTAIADDQTTGVQSTAQATTGKTTAAPQQRISNIQAQVAGAEAQAIGTQNNQNFQAAASNLMEQKGMQDESFALQSAGMEERRLANRDQLANRTAELLQQLKQGKESLSLDKQRADLDQIGVMTRLSDEKYITNLQREGNLARLNDQTNWETEYTRAVLDANHDLLKQALGNKDILNINQNEFKKLIEEMDINFAIQLAVNENKAASQQAQYKAAGDIVSGVTEYAARKKD